MSESICIGNLILYYVLPLTQFHITGCAVINFFKKGGETMKRIVFVFILAVGKFTVQISSHPRKTSLNFCINSMRLFNRGNDLKKIQDCPGRMMKKMYKTGPHRSPVWKAIIIES